MQRIRVASGVAALFLALLVLGACGSAGGSRQQHQAQEENVDHPVTEITITANDGSIEMEPSISSAPTLFVLENNGTRPYEAKFARLNEGVTMRDLKASLDKGPDAVFSLITLAGEVRRTSPGKTDSLTIDLAPGSYVVVDPNYVAKGMVQPFEVTTSTQTTDQPPSDVDVALGDFSIDMPSTLPSGAMTFRVANEGGQAHEILLLQEGDDPDRHTPGVTPFNPGSTVWADFVLEPGKYVAVCNFPDTETGTSHAALGMKTEFIVE